MSAIATPPSDLSATPPAPEPDAWWSSLRHFGLLLSPAEVARLGREHDREPLSWWAADKLRRYQTRLAAGELPRPEYVSWVLENVCELRGLPSGRWLRGAAATAVYAKTLLDGGTLRPSHVWRGEHGGELPVFLDTAGSALGMGRGRRLLGDVIQWLRLSGRPFALLTNTRQWRLVYAGIDFDAACEWDSDLWFEEGRPSQQMQAFRLLLQPALLDAAPADEDEAAEPVAEPTIGEAPLEYVSTPAIREAVLLAAVRTSRRGQSELSAALGERVREAVELLVRAHGSQLDAAALGATGAEIYRAAVRIVMRMVFVLFAESRGLLPRDNPTYEQAYGLQSLVHQLEKIAHRSRGRLAHTYAAWPRILALFRLVHEGSWHEALPLTAYGGELFAPGRADDRDPVGRALAFFESACFSRGEELVPDSVVHELLERLTRTRIRIRQGNTSRTTTVPVDFSDLSSEYIGILYEGLLDYELRTAEPDDPVIFLGIGNEPALPLSRLEQMEDKQVAELFRTLKESKADSDEEEEEEAGEDADADQSEAPNDQDEDDGDAADTDEDVAAVDTSRERAEAWARRACVAAGLVKKLPAKAGPEKVARFERDVRDKVRSLVRRVVLPGQWYLVRWGGTRKGAGTFYTRPGLAVPTVHRTLRPLAWQPPEGADGTPDLDAPASAWKPRRPEEILSLKVCDPGCGSGSFLIASLRFLTDALFASLFEHGRITGDWHRPLPELLGLVAAGAASAGDAETLPCPPDADDFEVRTRAVLRRYVVERCVYGVDIDPLAIELARLALWIETMDRELPFTFLDHKVRCGNSLVGAWFDQFQHYPLMAWKNREGGDKNHTGGVHFEKEERTKALKEFTRGPLTEDAKRFFAGRTLFSADLLEQASGVHEQALAVLRRLHDLPVHDTAERSRIYRNELVGSPEWQSLKEAMDLWCSCWFWPADALDHAPLPSTLARPAEETRRIAAEVAAARRFFHWELEFPDVFREAGSGFDAIVGNPPWETLQPNSKEYFSNTDPLYRSYGKQDALRRQTELFVDPQQERLWLDYNSRYSDDSNWMKYAANPFGDPEQGERAIDRFSIATGAANGAAHDRWRAARSRSRSMCDPAHPFRYRGEGKAYTYKLFLEQSHALLRDGGRLGMIVPSGIYSDHGTGALRELFLEHCRWEWLFGFENRERIFDIDTRFKFNPLIVSKGGSTAEIRTSFMRRRLEDWENAEAHATGYTKAQVTRFSPRSRAILEIQSRRDLEILEKIYANSVLLGDEGPDGWGIRYAQGDFNMTSDSKLFPPRPKWEADGYRPDEYSRWLKGDWRPIESLWPELGINPSHVVPIDQACLEEIEARGPEVARTAWRVRCAQPPYDSLPVPRADIPAGIILSREADAWIAADKIQDVALPLYEGRMIGQFDFSKKGWVSGKGRGAVWDDRDTAAPEIAPQYLMRQSDYFERVCHGPGAENLPFSYETAYERTRGVSIIDVTSSTNARTTYAAIVPPAPHGHSAPILYCAESVSLSGIMNSFVFDWVARTKQSGLHLVWAVLEELPLPWRTNPALRALGQITAALNLRSPIMARARADVHAIGRAAETSSERLRLRVIADVLAAISFGLSAAELREVLRDCDRDDPSGDQRQKANLDPKGFWRVDRAVSPELRHSTLTIIAMESFETVLKSSGGDFDLAIHQFLGLKDNQGWMIPAQVRLSDYGLGRSERSRVLLPVADSLGERFYDWQLSRTPAEVAAEDAVHVKNLSMGTQKTHSRTTTSASRREKATDRIKQRELF